MQGVSRGCTEPPVPVRIRSQSRKEPQLSSILLQKQLQFMVKKTKNKTQKKYQATVKKDKDATCVEGFIPGPSALGTEMAEVAFSPAASRSVIKAAAPPPAQLDTHWHFQELPVALEN